MTNKELEMLMKGYKLGRLCEKIGKAAGGAHIVNIGYDTQGDYFFLKDYGQEVKSFAILDDLIVFMEEAYKRLMSNGNLLD